MSDQPKQIQLHGRVIISGIIKTVTGLHIGKGKEGVAIGGVDNPIMRDSLTNEPYIPGSSLKGKLRSLAEKATNAPQEQSMGQEVKIHVAQSQVEYDRYWVNTVFGVPGEVQYALTGPTRLVVRDGRLTQDSKTRLLEADTDLPFTEVKYEAAIDRVTAAANPRPLERVPAETEFTFEMVFSIYQDKDKTFVKELIGVMRNLEDDYLGGSGSRGSGKVAFKALEVIIRPTTSYLDTAQKGEMIKATDLADLLGKFGEVDKAVSAIIKAGE